MTDTKDLLYLVLSVAVIWITFFLCWALYELATFSRRVNKIVDDVQQKIDRVEEMVESFKEKIANPLSYLGLLASGGKTMYSVLKNKKGKKKKSLLDEDE